MKIKKNWKRGVPNLRLAFFGIILLLSNTCVYFHAKNNACINESEPILKLALDKIPATAAHDGHDHHNHVLAHINPLYGTEDSVKKIKTFSLKSVIKNEETAKDDRKWEIIDFQDDSNPHGFKCDWVPFISSTGVNKQAGGKQIEMCVHSFDDIVSNVIRGVHRWQDCDVLPEHWEQSIQNVPASELSNASNKKKQSIYLEIGANIGSCIMEMLFSTNAPIIAFEPNPKNLFPLRETMRRLDKSYQDRVVLLPIALGASKSSNTIYAANNNMGNSQVGTAVKDLDIDGQAFLVKDQFDIQVDRLEDVLELGGGGLHSDNVDVHIDIRLVKMDAQGFECEILKGMGQEVADKIHHVHFEKADLFLKAHNCEDLLQRFHGFGFDIYRDQQNLVHPSNYNQPMPYDLDAKRHDKV